MMMMKFCNMLKNEKKFGAHKHFTPHMTTKCCNITTTVNNASISTLTIKNLYIPRIVFHSSMYKFDSCHKIVTALNVKLVKKFGAHTHLTTHMTTKVLQYYHNSK